MTGGFVASLAAIVLLIVTLTPEYARPAVQAAAAGTPTPSSSPIVLIEPDPSPTSPAPESLSGYRWPLRGATVLTWFGPSKSGFIRGDDGRLHEGIDLTSRCEAPVVAAHKGAVVAAGRAVLGEVGFDAEGDEIAELHRKHISKTRRADGIAKDVLPITVVIDDGNGYRSLYKHLADVAVKAGDEVKAGTVIGTTGQSGGVARCQVQYELVRMDGDWQHVVEREIERLGYPDWIRERVDPLLVLSLDDKGAPRITRRNPPRPGSLPAGSAAAGQDPEARQDREVAQDPEASQDPEAGQGPEARQA